MLAPSGGDHEPTPEKRRHSGGVEVSTAITAYAQFPQLHPQAVIG
jgi:hypothetical protein